MPNIDIDMTRHDIDMSAKIPSEKKNCLLTVYGSKQKNISLF